MKTCGFEKQISKYLDGELSGAKLRSFEAHLEACPTCREQVEQYRGMLDELRGLEDSEVPPMLQDRLHATLVNEIAKGDGRVKRKINPWALTAAAAAVVVCLVSGALLLNGANNPAGILATPNTSLAGAAPDSAPQNRAGALMEQRSLSKGDFTAEATTETPPQPAPAAEDTEKTADGYAGLDTGEHNAVVMTTDQATKQPGDGRKLIYTANLVLETREYDKCTSTIDAILAEYGGYVENSQSSGVPEANAATMGRSMTVSLRMPIDKYSKAMAELQAMGNVLDKKERTDDVSREYVDTEARNKTLKEQRDRLYDLLAKADSMENIIALQNEITRLTVEIEQMTAQLNFWNDKVSYSTITVELHELVIPKSVKPADPDLNARVNGAFYDTINSMKKGLENFAVGFVGFLPWLAVMLVIAGVLAAVLVPMWRKAARRAAEQKDTMEQKDTEDQTQKEE